MSVIIRERVKEIAAAKGLSLAALARDLDTSAQHFNTILGKEALRLEWVERIAVALDVHPASLLKDLGSPIKFGELVVGCSVGGKVKCLASIKKISISDMAEQMDISRQSLHGTLKSGNPTLSSIIRMADVLKVHKSVLVSPISDKEWIAFGKSQAGKQ